MATPLHASWLRGRFSIRSAGQVPRGRRRPDRVLVPAAGTGTGYGPLYCVTAKFELSQAGPALVPFTVVDRLVTDSGWLFGLRMVRSIGCGAPPGASDCVTSPDSVNDLDAVALATTTWSWLEAV